MYGAKTISRTQTGITLCRNKLACQEMHYLSASYGKIPKKGKKEGGVKSFVDNCSLLSQTFLPVPCVMRRCGLSALLASPKSLFTPDAIQ